jgi:hypothetical protein
VAKPRAKKPAKPLTPAQRRKRRLAKNPLYNPTKVLSGADLADAAKALTNLDLNPQLSALDTQAKTTQTQGTGLIDKSAGFYRDIASQEADRVARQKALSDRLNATLSGIASDSQTTADRAKQDVTDAQAADTAVRGPGLSGGGDQAAAADLAAQRARAGQTAETFRSSGASQGANNEAFLNASAAAQGMHAGEVHKQLVNQLANRLGDIASKRTSVESTRGASDVKNLTTLRQQGFENIATMQGLGIKEQDLAAQTADQAARRELAKQQAAETRRNNRRRARIAQQGQSETHRHNVTTEGQGQQRIDQGGKKAKKPSKPSEAARKTVVQIGDAVTQYGTLKQKFGGDLSKVAANARKHGVPEHILNAAADISNFGYITPGHVRALLDAGVQRRQLRRWLKPPTFSSGGAFANKV